MLFHGDATSHTPQLFSEPLRVWRQRTEELQGHVTESIAAFAQPSGTPVRPVYEAPRDELLSDLQAAGDVDIVLLSVHGAMVGEGYDDCERRHFARVRAIVGPQTIVGVELELHCSITSAMTEHADAIVTFKEYPHIDGGARAQELFTLCLAAQRGETRPVMAVYECRMINMWRTREEPMRSVVADMQACEGNDGVLSVSFAHGFPWGDVAHASARVLVITDGDIDKTQGTAHQFGEQLWSLRDETTKIMLDMDAALDRIAAAGSGPVILADVADSAGGGVPADATFMLERLIARGMSNSQVFHPNGVVRASSGHCHINVRTSAVGHQRIRTFEHLGRGIAV